MTEPVGREGRDLAALAAFVGGAQLAGFVGVPFTRTGPDSWYEHLRKPGFTPPPAVFGPTWTALYGAIGTAAWRAWRAPDRPERTRALRWWGAQLLANAAWTPVFFGARRPGWALAEQAVVDAAAVATLVHLRRVDGPAAAWFAPYVAWLGFATALNAGIVALNRSR